MRILCKHRRLLLGGEVDLVRVGTAGRIGGPLARARVGGPGTARAGAGGAHSRVLLCRIVARALAGWPSPARAPGSRHHVLRSRLIASAVQR